MTSKSVTTMELTYAEKKTIEKALAILERNEDERAKRFAIENEVKIDLHKMVYYAAYYQGALMAAKELMGYAKWNAKGDDRVYRDAELALITQSKRTMVVLAVTADDFVIVRDATPPRLVYLTAIQ